MASGRRLVSLLGVLGCLVVGVGTEATASAAGAASAPSSAIDHLEEILARSSAPTYRRFGSPGMADVADYSADRLTAAGFTVVRPEATAEVWDVDYRQGHAPLLQRLSDGEVFATEGTFFPEATTPDDGVTCTVRMIEDVTPGDCGFVTFEQVSPEWKNLQGDVLGALDQIIAKGGVGAVLQGDVARNALIAVRARRPLAMVVAVVDANDVVGQSVRLRAQGSARAATLRNVVGVRRAADPTKGYLVLQGHVDGWFTAAADNGSGVATVLAAAERLASADLDRGLIVALYDGEEWGLLGSKAVADRLGSEPGLDVGDCGPPLRFEDVVGVVNLDASSARPSDVDGPIQDLLDLDEPLFSWRAMVVSEEVVLPSAFLSVMTAHHVLGLPVTVTLADPLNGGIGRTDGKWLHEQGIPVVWPVAGYPEYHTTADTLATIDPVDLAALTDATVDLLTVVDDLPIGRVNGAPEPSAIVPAAPVCAPDASGTTDAAGSTPATDGLARTGRDTPVAVIGALVLAAALAVRRLTLRRN